LDLTPYVSNPCEAKSIMGYVNTLTLIGYLSVDNELEQNTPKNDQLSATAINEPSEYSPGAILTISATIVNMYNIHNYDDLLTAAEAVMEHYKTKMDAEQEVKIEGLAPALQSLVQYNSFVPIDSPDEPELIFGMVLERKIDYSIDGFQCTIKIHPTKTITTEIYSGALNYDADMTEGDYKAVRDLSPAVQQKYLHRTEPSPLAPLRWLERMREAAQQQGQYILDNAISM
jgi:hypothetical protein